MAHTMNQPQNLREKTGETADKARDFAGNMADKARDAAGTMADKAKEAAGTLAEKAKGAATTMADKASDLGHALAETPKQATTAVGTGLKNVAESIREHAPQSGMLHSASTKIADSLESGGEYVKEKGIPGMAGDVTELIRKNPVPAVLLGICVGFLIARSLRS